MELIPLGSGLGTPHQRRTQRGSAWCLVRWQVQSSTERNEGTRTQQNRFASLPHLELTPMSAPGPTGELQEHLDAIISFARVGQWRRQFRCIDILTIKLAIGDLPEECRFLFNTQLIFLKKEQDPTQSSSTMMSGFDR